MKAASHCEPTKFDNFYNFVSFVTCSVSRFGAMAVAACAYDVLIVGSGHAGAQAAIALRQGKFDGSVAIVGEEPDLPYERPPLSKDYLAGEKPFDRLLLRPAQFWAERDVALLLGRRATVIDPDRHEVQLGDGEAIGYGRLVWAAGGHPRALSCSGHDLAGVHSVRTRADVDHMVSALDRVVHVAVIGGGYIGLETAASLVKLGKQVTVLEALDRVLARVAGPTISRFFETEHRSHGVDLRVGVGVTCIEGREGHVTGVRLADGCVLPADLVIVGIGIQPAVEPLLSAGARGGNGVVVDEFCRTSLADIYAIGDCALHENRFAAGQTIRLESVQNANDQANVVARDILGAAAPYDAVPWFWSNQYDLRLQTVGISSGFDREIVRGIPANRAFSVAYLRAGRVIAFDCVNATHDYVQGKALVAASAMVDPDLLADAETALKDLAALEEGGPGRWSS